MKKVLVALLLGLGVGYTWGFGEGSHGQSNVAVRVLNKFGVATLKEAERIRTERTEEASRP